jgi:3-dehydroquinate synthase class II
MAKKLRLGRDHQVAVLNAPDGYAAQLQPGPAGIRTELEPNASYDAVVLFVKDVAELRRLGSTAIHAVKPNGLLWITYPKGGKTKGVTDLPATPSWVQRDVLGEITSEAGYKAVSFVALDDQWTALRFKRV